MKIIHRNLRTIRRDLSHPSRRMSEPILTSQVTQRLTSRRQSAPERGTQLKNQAPRRIGPPLFAQRDSMPGTSARCIERSFDVHEDWLYLDKNTPLHADIWETMKTFSDSRFVREVVLKLWGTEGLQQRCLDAKRANKGKENSPDEKRTMGFVFLIYNIYNAFLSFYVLPDRYLKYCNTNDFK